MAINRLSPTLSTADVLDRVLDKGIVIEAEIRIAVAGIELVTVSASSGRLLRDVGSLRGVDGAPTAPRW